MESKKIAKHDITYCESNDCKNKCWRHVSNWEFSKNEFYSVMLCCENYVKEGVKDE